jgi:hypothetical protein
MGFKVVHVALMSIVGICYQGIRLVNAIGGQWPVTQINA